MSKVDYKRFLYIPSFSSGEFANDCKKDTLLKGTLPVRFYSDDFPQKYQHKAFLLTAGHLYRKMEIRKTMGLENSFVLGDSGGYQIATGVLKWDNNLRDKIFEWLESNSDVAMNLDIPPRGQYANKFDESLQLSYDNFKYFEEKQSGKTKFLNVLQGNNQASYEAWYQKVKDFQFNGWGLGGCAANYYMFVSAIYTLIKGKEHLKKNNKYFHILGTSKISDFFILSQLQKSLDEVGSDVLVTTDSSSPSRSTAFGLYYIGASLHKDTFKTLHIPKATSSNKDYVAPEGIKTLQSHHLDMPMPRVVEFDKILESYYNYGDCVNTTNNSAVCMALHNFMLFKEMMYQIHDYVHLHDYILEQVTSPETLRVLRIIDEIVKSDNPESVFLKHEGFLIEQSNAGSGEVTPNLIGEFFTT